MPKVSSSRLCRDHYSFRHITDWLLKRPTDEARNLRLFRKQLNERLAERQLLVNDQIEVEQQLLAPRIDHEVLGEGPGVAEEGVQRDDHSTSNWRFPSIVLYWLLGQTKESLGLLKGSKTTIWRMMLSWMHREKKMVSIVLWVDTFIAISYVMWQRRTTKWMLGWRRWIEMKA